MKQNSRLHLLKIIKNLQVVYNDKERKPFARMLKEFLITSIYTKSIATHYFTSFLYRENITNYLDYLCTKEWQYLQRVICDSETAALQFNKFFFQQYFENAKVPMPKLLAYNIREKMIMKNADGWSAHEIVSLEDLDNIINELLEKSTNDSLFIKPATGSEGKGVIRISNRHTESPSSTIAIFINDFLSGAYVFQDEVKQHKDLAKLNPDTLNTLRIDTFKKPGSRPEIISGLLRVGRAGGCVDNTGSGGMFIGINMTDGTLKEFGRNYLPHGGKLFRTHPDTGIKFHGFQIPLFDDVKKLVIDAGSWLPQSLMGWDIAVSENGPLLIEGNSVYYSLTGLDISYGGYRKNPVYCKVVDYVKNDLKK